MKSCVGRVLILTALLLAAEGASAAPESNVSRVTLDNGLRVVIVRDSLAPVAALEMNYLVGSNDAPKGFPGTAHAVEHMMFRGGPGLTHDQLMAIGADLGGAFNARTTNTVTQYYFVVPSEDLRVALQVEALRMRGVDMDPAQWTKERGAIEQEVRQDLSNPIYKLGVQANAALFAGTPYAQSALGTRDSFEKTTAAMLKRFHDAWYAPNNAILVITGNVDPTVTLAQVRELFGDIPPKKLPPRPVFQFEPVKARTIQLPTDFPVGVVMLAYHMPGTASKDYAAAAVLADVLASKRGALFAMGLDGSALFGGFQVDFGPQMGLGIAVGGVPSGGDPQPVLDRMRSILLQATTQGVDPELIESAKRKEIAGLEFQANSIGGLANSWSNALAWQGWRSPDAFRAAIEAVTPADVERVARSIFEPAHCLTGILSPQSSGKPVSSQGYGGMEQFAGVPGKPVELPEWAGEAFTHITVPALNLHPVVYTLQNGLKVVVQQETVSDTIVVAGGVRTNEDLQAPKGEEGVAGVLGGMFQFGAADLNRLQFQQALDALPALESGGSGFSLSVPAEHFAEGMRLLADNELHPVFSEQAFRMLQQRDAGFLRGQIRSPAFLEQLSVQQALLPATDPELRYATPKSVVGLTLEEVEAYYQQVFRPDMTTMVIVGNIEPQQAKAVVEQTFGGWQAKGPKPEVDYAAVPLNKATGLHAPDASSVQDGVLLVENVDATRDSPTRYALVLGSQLLGGSADSILFRDLREGSGLVYSVSSGFNLGKYRSTFSVSFGTDPDKVRAARDRVVADIRELQTQLQPQAVLDRAKNTVLHRIPLGEASFEGIGAQLLRNVSQGLPQDQERLDIEHFLSLTPADVEHAFAEHVRLNDFVTSVRGPVTK